MNRLQLQKQFMSETNTTILIEVNDKMSTGYKPNPEFTLKYIKWLENKIIEMSKK